MASRLLAQLRSACGPAGVGAIASVAALCSSTVITAQEAMPSNDASIEVRVSLAPHEETLRQRIAASPADLSTRLELARVYRAMARQADVETTLRAAVDAAPDRNESYEALTGFFSSGGQFDAAIDTAKKWATAFPLDAHSHYALGAAYLQRLQRGPVSSSDLTSAMVAAQAAIALAPDHAFARGLVGAILRVEAQQPENAARRQALEEEAANFLPRSVAVGPVSGVVPVPRWPEEMERAAIRVGGAMAPPRRTRVVMPVYPETAVQALIEGTVVIEALIDASGRVTDARLLRSLPLLDDAAVEAVRQWEFEPSLRNGRAVPVLTTLSVSFTLH